MHETATPKMFSEIADRYDLLNHLLSLNIDKSWRKRVVQASGVTAGGRVLDACTGTGDIAVGFAQYSAACEIIGVDLSLEMMRVGREKAAREKLDGKIQFVEGDVLGLPFGDGVFDAVVIAFGLRNLPDYASGVSEMTRVLGRGGRLVILEFSPPAGGVFQKAYGLYLRKMIPLIGRLVSGNRQAYDYLASSVGEFLPREQVLGLLDEAGLKDLRTERLTGGVAHICFGDK